MSCISMLGNWTGAAAERLRAGGEVRNSLGDILLSFYWWCLRKGFFVCVLGWSWRSRYNAGLHIMAGSIWRSQMMCLLWSTWSTWSSSQKALIQISKYISSSVMFDVLVLVLYIVYCYCFLGSDDVYAFVLGVGQVTTPDDLLVAERILHQGTPAGVVSVWC